MNSEAAQLCPAKRLDLVDIKKTGSLPTLFMVLITLSYTSVSKEVGKKICTAIISVAGYDLDSRKMISIYLR